MRLKPGLSFAKRAASSVNAVLRMPSEPCWFTRLTALTSCSTSNEIVNEVFMAGKVLGSEAMQQRGWGGGGTGGGFKWGGVHWC